MSVCQLHWLQGRSKGGESVGASSNVVGMICPPVKIGLIDMPKTEEWGGRPMAPRFPSVPSSDSSGLSPNNV